MFACVFYIFLFIYLFFFVCMCVCHIKKDYLLTYLLTYVSFVNNQLCSVDSPHIIKFLTTIYNIFRILKLSLQIKYS